LILLVIVGMISTDRRKAKMDLKSPTPVIHHHHHRSKTVKDAKVDAVANEVLGQLNNAR